MTDEMRAKVEKVMKNLERNKMKPYFCENREEAQALVKTLIFFLFPQHRTLYPVVWRWGRASPR